MQTTAAILRQPNGPYEICQVELDAPRADEVLVRIVAVGICHSDVVFASGFMGNSFPLLLGHEGAGIVEAIGSGVTKVKPGDKVLLTFDSCGHCRQCASDSPAYCSEFAPLNFAAVRADGTSPVHIDGELVAARFFGQSSFASHAIAQERNVVAVPQNADLTMLAPLGCGVQTGAGAVLNSLNAKAGGSLIVFGGGAVGLSAVMGGVIAGCSTIILVEPREDRRRIGLDLGAQHAIDPMAGDLTEAVRSILPAGADYAVDSSGNVGVLTTAVSLLGPMGKLGMLGTPPALDSALPVPIIAANTLGITVKGIIEGDSDPDQFLPYLVALHSEGRLNVDRFIRHYPFAQINDAMADLHSGACVKAVLLLE
ncbi:NAD(P)-dependent alcohol dehydrogenase [soil metagenome]